MTASLDLRGRQNPWTHGSDNNPRVDAASVLVFMSEKVSCFCRVCGPGGNRDPVSRPRFKIECVLEKRVPYVARTKSSRESRYGITSGKDRAAS